LLSGHVPPASAPLSLALPSALVPSPRRTPLEPHAKSAIDPLAAITKKRRSIMFSPRPTLGRDRRVRSWRGDDLRDGRAVGAPGVLLRKGRCAQSRVVATARGDERADLEHRYLGLERAPWEAAAKRCELT
jgi:hypothetical protein